MTCHQVTILLGALFALANYHCALSGFIREHVQDDCLTCICEASTNCNRTIGCLGDLCGMFAITFPFWRDANRPTIPSDEPHMQGAFERCVTDPICASETIKNYMDRFAKDCNNDGVIDCHDYARIHRFGPFDCEHPLDAKFDSKFDPCMDDIGQPANHFANTNGINKDDIFK